MDSDTSAITPQINEKKRRFASTTPEERDKLKEERNAKNTNRATIASVAILREYMSENNMQPLEDIPNADLPKLLERFYCDARTKENERYKTGSFKSLRSNINRYFKEKRGINICADSSFTDANIMFKSVQVKAKKLGKGSRNSTPVIDDCDLVKIGEYFNQDYIKSPDGYRLRETVMFYIIYFFCRRGQENLYEMTKNHFVLRFENGVRFLEQNVDELDKNHRENYDKQANQGKMYERPGKLNLLDLNVIKPVHVPILSTEK